MGRPKQSSRLQYPWYLEGNEMGNRALSQLLKEEDACNGIPDEKRKQHNVWGCEDIGAALGLLAGSNGFQRASIFVWKRSERGPFMVLRGSVNLR
jgi:hypothetical protein